MRLHPALILFLTLCSTLLHCKPVTDSITHIPVKKPSLFIFAAGYRTPVNKQKIINSGHGFYVEGGINSAYFFPEKIQLGVFAGWAMTDKLWSTSFNNSFISDYSKAITTEQRFSEFDTALIHLSSKLMATKKGRSLTMPGCEMQSFHNYSLYYGLVFKFPARFSPLLKIYTGSTRSHYQGPGGLIGDGDYTIIRLKRKMMGCEILLTQLINTPRHVIFSRIGFGFYYEYCNFTTAALNGDTGTQSSDISLSRYTSSSFLQKYKHEHAFGIKLSFTMM